MIQINKFNILHSLEILKTPNRHTTHTEVCS